MMNGKSIVLAGLTLAGLTASSQEVSRRRDVDFAALKVTQQTVEAVKGEAPSLLPQGNWKLVWNDEFNGNDRIDYTVDPNEWHRFGLLWTPTNYVYYCDGRETARSSKMVSQVEEFLIVSCEVKGWREGQMDKSGAEINKAAIRPDGTLVDDAFEVDYVRVFDTMED